MTRQTHLKKHAQRTHAQRRALERYGLNYTRQVRFDLIKIIETGNVLTLANQSQRVTILVLRYRDKPYKIAWDKLRKEIITFLPLESSTTEDDAELENVDA